MEGKWGKDLNLVLSDELLGWNLAGPSVMANEDIQEEVPHEFENGIQRGVMCQ